tara:strand:+ start:201 stop:662 length:462 start_codon:yes stop_codon:yes gene_type:complete
MTPIPFEIDISHQSSDWPDCDLLVQKAITSAWNVLTIPRAGELSVALSNDEQVQALNRDYRNNDKPTNVLSFPVAEPAPLLGDIVLALETVQREANEKAISFEDHLTHLLIHGFLHLQGYDHENEDEAEIMEALEIRALSALAIDNPYKTDEF